MLNYSESLEQVRAKQLLTWNRPSRLLLVGNFAAEKTRPTLRDPKVTWKYIDNLGLSLHFKASLQSASYTQSAVLFVC